MADTYTVIVPVVTAVTLTPNPTAINHALAVAATVSETTKTLYAEDRRGGEMICGEA